MPRAAASVQTRMPPSLPEKLPPLKHATYFQNMLPRSLSKFRLKGHLQVGESPWYDPVSRMSLE